MISRMDLIGYPIEATYQQSQPSLHVNIRRIPCSEHNKIVSTEEFRGDTSNEKACETIRADEHQKISEGYRRIAILPRNVKTSLIAFRGTLWVLVSVKLDT